jgi:hypothetical protein
MNDTSLKEFCARGQKQEKISVLPGVCLLQKRYESRQIQLVLLNNEPYPESALTSLLTGDCSTRGSRDWLSCRTALIDNIEDWQACETSL